MHFLGKIGAPLNLVLAPRASIRKNTVPILINSEHSRELQLVGNNRYHLSARQLGNGVDKEAFRRGCTQVLLHPLKGLALPIFADFLYGGGGKISLSIA